MARAILERSSTPKRANDGLRKRYFFFFDSKHFWRGFSGAYEAFGRQDRLLDNYDPWYADYKALRGDWEAVGIDMHRAMRRFEIEHAEELAGQGRLFDPDQLR